MKIFFYSFVFFLFLNFNLLISAEIIIEQNEWPCKLHHLKPPKQTDYWPGKEINLDSKWKNDSDVRELVNYITNHANSIDQGKKAINDFSNKFNDKNIKEKRKMPILFNNKKRKEI